ncbi:hypothetical protein [Actinomadura rupiterrae]|uniref:hypothetical protein n=1 Tax=Actinomadura rupiterrae TaxID=559627 RepID=UPI0020A3DCD9|nr:hypothetical protein [Actinomadura rupiterrae]MCP2340588.1 hypothetical protein [Actinomadura rupiterrae]
MGEQPLSEAEASVWAPAARALVVELAARGLVAKVRGHGAVWARNPAGEPAPDDPVGTAASPGLSQEVWCRPDWPDRELWWWWAWSVPRPVGDDSDGSPLVELEPLCPAKDAARAAEAIARVLAVPFADAGVS